MTAASAFEYPAGRHVRRHGPIGYTDYESYREWLRDDFTFRCVYCLRREQWSIRHGSFHIDHFVPQSIDSARACDYENLIYACAACNLKKSELNVPDPCAVSFSDCLRVHPDGRIEAVNSEGQLLVDILRLDDEDYTRYRKMLLETLKTLEEHNYSTFVEWMRFPDDLPDLSTAKRRPPGGNSRPNGMAESWFNKRRHGKLPKTY